MRGKARIGTAPATQQQRLLTSSSRENLLDPSRLSGGQDKSETRWEVGGGAGRDGLCRRILSQYRRLNILRDCDDLPSESQAKIHLDVTRESATGESGGGANVVLLFLGILSLPLSRCESLLQTQLARSNPRRREKSWKQTRENACIIAISFLSASLTGEWRRDGEGENSRFEPKRECGRLHNTEVHT